jgi:hypothetical protein
MMEEIAVGIMSLQVIAPFVFDMEIHVLAR